MRRRIFSARRAVESRIERARRCPPRPFAALEAPSELATVDNDIRSYGEEGMGGARRDIDKAVPRQLPRLPRGHARAEQGQVGLLLWREQKAGVHAHLSVWAF